MNVLMEQFLFQSAIEWVPRYNIAPTQEIAVVRAAPDDLTGRELLMMRWGLVPSWSRDPGGGARMINARAETVAEKPSFRSAAKKRRCLVLADGYYEWQRVGRNKQPHWIHLANDRPFAMAGLWERWNGAGEVQLDTPLLTCTIITTQANAIASKIHDRMPVILDDTLIDAWLNATDVDSAWLERMLIPCNDRIDLQVDAVGDYVNNARHEGARCLDME